MKILLTSILALSFLFTGCATKSDLQQTNDRLSRVEVSENCHGKIVELQLALRQFQNPELQQDPMAMMALQMEVQAMAPQVEAACKKLDAQNKADAEAASKAK